MRSLITLKALIHRPTGGIVAAPTSSLPERPGGARNWDYRYCWLRDATFMLLALIQMRADATRPRPGSTGCAGPSAASRSTCSRSTPIDGERRAIEWEADWLAGFNGAQPVRFGNGAGEQLQLDIYGEVIDALYQARKAGHRRRRRTATSWSRLLADRLAEIWEEPDAGIWESRGEPRQHTYSKAMCWVGFDRAAEWFAGSDPEPAAALWRAGRQGARTGAAERLERQARQLRPRL